MSITCISDFWSKSRRGTMQKMLTPHLFHMLLITQWRLASASAKQTFSLSLQCQGSLSHQGRHQTACGHVYLAGNTMCALVVMEADA